MDRGWRYRIASGLGTIVIGIAAVAVTNLPPVHEAFSAIPLLGRPAPEVLPPGELRLATLTMLVVIVASMWPLFKPRPRRILDTIVLTHKRVLLAMVFLAAIGYFNYSYRLPRTTLMLTTLALLVALPLFMVAIRKQPRSGSNAVIVGDDPNVMGSLLIASNLDIVGYVSSPAVHAEKASEASAISVTDGGQTDNRLTKLSCLGGLARLDDVLVNHDVNTALLAFSETDREEFFGTLETCHKNGISPMVHQDYTDNILTGEGFGPLVEVDIEPWETEDYIAKRIFDIVFATTALIALLPLIFIIAIAIKLDSEGPVFFRQKRTRRFGGEFTFVKFRTMVQNAEELTGVTISEEDAGGHDPRVTRVGRYLRKTHLDEIPQLWSVLTGEMSIVGPRPAQAEIEDEFEEVTSEWGKRWFVKPGLTGLAQINDVTGLEPEKKLYYDLAYIRKQSLLLDIKIVLRQLWKVVSEVRGFICGEEDSDSDNE